jgi:hypothetical protein
MPQGIARRAIGSAVAGLAILAAGCTGGQADRPAGPDPAEISRQNEARERAADLIAAAEQRLGKAFAGGYLADSGEVVVFTTDPETTGTLRELGARPELVRFSKATLADWQQRVTEALRPDPPRAVTSWGIEIRRNAVVVDVLAGRPTPPQLHDILVESAGAVVVDEVRAPVTPLPGG